MLIRKTYKLNKNTKIYLYTDIVSDNYIELFFIKDNKEYKNTKNIIKIRNYINRYNLLDKYGNFILKFNINNLSIKEIQNKLIINKIEDNKVNYSLPNIFDVEITYNKNNKIQQIIGELDNELYDRQYQYESNKLKRIIGENIVIEYTKLLKDYQERIYINKNCTILNDYSRTNKIKRKIIFMKDKEIRYIYEYEKL